MKTLLLLAFLSSTWRGFPGDKKIEGGINLTFEITPSTQISYEQHGNEIMYAVTEFGVTTTGTILVDEPQVVASVSPNVTFTVGMVPEFAFAQAFDRWKVQEQL